MGEIGQIANAVDKLSTDYTRRAMNAFAVHYNERKDDMFRQAHGYENPQDYDKNAYTRVAFKSKSEIELFVQDMQSQGISAVGMPFRLNGQYIAEIPVKQEDGRSGAEVIEDFRARCYVDTQDEAQAAYERVPQNANIGDGLADALVVNHLESLGTAIHKIQEVAYYLGANQYGQSSNNDIFNSSININGEAAPSVQTDSSKMATVINGNTVIMDGVRVTNQDIVENVLAQHKERMEHAEKIVSHIGDTISPKEREQLASTTSYVNKQADLLATYEKRLENGESLSVSQRAEYEKAQQIISELERDMGRTIDADHHITRREMRDFNQAMLQRIEEAGIGITRPNSGVFDTEAWRQIDRDSFSQLGLSASSQSLIYNLNADAKQLSVQQLNAEAILDGSLRQDYAVTASARGIQTVKDPNTIFGAWTLGALESISNNLNAEVVSKETIVESKLKEHFSDAQSELIKATVSSYNDGIVQEAVEQAIQSVDPSLGIGLDELMTKNSITQIEYDFTSADSMKSLNAKYDTSRKEMIEGVFSENPNLESYLKKNNITVQDIISSSPDAARKLDLFAQSQASSPELAALQSLRTDVSALNRQQIAETTSFLEYSFSKERNEAVLSAIKKNSELSAVLSTHGITVESLANGANGTGEILNRLIDEHKGTELFKPLVHLRDDLERVSLDESKALKNLPQDKPLTISSYKDLLDVEKSGALVAEKFKIERENYLAGVLSGNQNLAQTLAANGITANDLISNASGATEKLNKLISKTNDASLSNQLISLKTNLSQSYTAEDRVKTELAQVIQGNVEDMSIKLSSLVDKDSHALSTVMKNVNATRIELYLSKNKSLSAILFSAGVNLDGLTSEQISSKLAELYQKKSHALTRQGNHDYIQFELKVIAQAQADFKIIQDEEKSFAKKLSNAFELSPYEQNMLTGNSNLWKDLQNVQWLKGKGLIDGVMTPEKLLDINAEFLKRANQLGYKFVGSNGFDIEFLQKLSKKDLENLGITEKIRNTLVEINRKGAFGNVNQLKSMFEAASKGVAFLIKNVDGNAENWQDVQEFAGNIQKGVKYTQSAITNIRRLRNIRPQDLHIFRRGGAQNLIEQWNKPIQPKKKPVKRNEGISAKPLTAKQQARQEKYAEKLKKKLTDTKTHQNSLWAKLNKQLAAAKKKIAESAIGKFVSAAHGAITGAVSTFLLYYIAGAAVLALFVQVIAIVGVMVICLVDTIKGAFDIGNWFAAETYKDTVAWNLYQDLLNAENRYVAELANTPSLAYDGRNLITYGFDGKTLSEYLEDFKNADGYSRLVYVTDNGGDVCINPFWREGYVTVDYNTDYLTTIDAFDGNHTYDISTNLNYYSIIEDPEAEKYEPVYGISNGHTSNIKDIIAMTDIMYQMEATESDDDSLNSVLGMTPSKLQWDDFLEHNVFKTIGEFFTNLWQQIFEGGSEWQFPSLTANSLTYETIQNYAMNLFEVSHQQYLYLSVDYCDKNKQIYNSNGTVVNLENGTEMVYGICANPILNNFKVKLDTSKNPAQPAPYVEREDGSIKFLDALNPDGTPWFDIVVSVEDNLAPSEVTKICLWDDMPTEDDVYNGHTYCVTNSTVWNRIKTNPCWKRTNYSSSDTYITASGSSDWERSRESAQIGAESDVRKNLRTILNREKKANYYIIKEDVAIGYEYSYVTSIDSSNVTYSDYDYDSDEGYYCCSCEGKTKYYTLTVTTYTRECKGHNFEYCGGHVSTHEQGNVFSVTNEQLTISDIYDEGKEPAALFTEYYNVGGGSINHSEPYTKSLYTGNRSGDFEIDKRYEELIGKVDRQNVDYSTASSAASTGGCVTPMQDIYQGSSVSHGLNIIVSGSGENGWGEGIEVQHGMVRYCRDIFDCDCIILKGCNVFPFKDYNKYEGWTADNMSLCINRLSMNWYELYGFEISTEIGEYNYTLSEQDIEMLLVGLEAEYGTLFSADRKELTEAILTYVGRGHYTNHHHPFEHSTDFTSEELDNANHGFLAYLCSSTNFISDSEGGYIAYSASCSAGNEVDIGNFVLNYINKKFDRKRGGCSATLVGTYGVANLLPADIVTHSAYDLAARSNRLDVNLGNNPVNGDLLYDFHLKDQAVMYVGRFRDSSIQAMKDYLATKLDADTYNEYTGTDGVVKLSTGQEISIGMPVCVDLNQMGIYSGLRLRTEGTASGNLKDYLPRYFTGGEHAADKDKANEALQTTYYWLIHPDSRTFSYKAEQLINPSW